MLVAPSILSADFSHLASEVEMVNSSQADLLHIDVMDGVFVPNISFGFPVLKHIAKLSTKPLDVHLMITDPMKFVSQVRDGGGSIMTIHYEACTHHDRAVQQIHDAGMKAAIALNPSTPVCMLRDIIASLDMVLLMSVNPGFGGQQFIPYVLNKTRELNQLIASTGSKAIIEIDGGINASTARQVAAAGANVLVAGSYVFAANNPHDAIKTLKEI